MDRLRKGLFGLVLALWVAGLGAAESQRPPCGEPACVEFGPNAEAARLSVALAKPADAVAGESTPKPGEGAAHTVFPLSLIAILFGLVGVVALARRRLEH